MLIGTNSTIKGLAAMRFCERRLTVEPSFEHRVTRSAHLLYAEDAVGNKVERRLVAACLMKKGFNALRKYGKALYAEKT